MESAELGSCVPFPVEGAQVEVVVVIKEGNASWSSLLDALGSSFVDLS